MKYFILMLSTLFLLLTSCFSLNDKLTIREDCEDYYIINGKRMTIKDTLNKLNHLDFPNNIEYISNDKRYSHIRQPVINLIEKKVKISNANFTWIPCISSFSDEFIKKNGVLDGDNDFGKDEDF